MSDKEQIRKLEEQARALGLSREQVESMKTAILSSPTTNASAPTLQETQGVPFGRYSLIERLGNGVLSKMYKAVSAEGEEVVLKIMRPDFMKSPFLDRFTEISTKMVDIFHPNWIISHEVIREPGLALVSEYLDGAPFSINDEPVPVEAVAFILREILTGLAYVHEKNEYHGNLKPSNVILCRDGGVKLLDWGMHRVLNASKGQSSSLWYGTLSHMAPEAHQGEWGPKVDIYAAGLLAWELLAGRPACPHQNIDAQRRWHASMGPMGIELVRSETPTWLVSIITAMCQRDPQLRPVGAMDVLSHWEEGYGTEDPREENPLEVPVPLKSFEEPKIVERPRSRRRRERARTRKKQIDGSASQEEVSKQKPKRTRERRESRNTEKPVSKPQREVSKSRKRKSSLLNKHEFFSRIQSGFQELLASMNVPNGVVQLKKVDALLLTEVISQRGLIGSLISSEIGFSTLAPKGYVLLSYDLLHNLFNRYSDGSAALKTGTRKERISHTDRRSLDRFMSPVFDSIKKKIPSGTIQKSKIAAPDTQGKREVGLYQVGTDKDFYGLMAIGIPPELFESAQPTHDDISGLAVEEEADVMSALMDISVSVRSTLPPFRLSYQSLQELSIGSVLPLPKNWNKNLRITFNDKVAFLGEYGVEEGSHAILLHSQYKKRK